MQYCTRCVCPANFQPRISFDDQGVCNYCREHELIEAKSNSYWQVREWELSEMLKNYRVRANGVYDCIIPVSGGKDSQYQVFIIKEKFGMNPLLVCYNHLFNSEIGIRNLHNLVKGSDCDLIRFTPSPGSVSRISKMGLHKMGDVTMHYHFGIPAFPAQIAVKYKIPLIILGEPYRSVPGLHSMKSYGQITGNSHGFVIEDFLSEEFGVGWKDLAPYICPTNNDLDEIGVKYLFLPSYVYWDGKQAAELMAEKYGFESLKGARDRTFNLYEHIDDGVNGTHDYLKYLKYGYGRCTDHVSEEIRFGRMTRNEGIDLVDMYDRRRPSDLDLWLDWVGMKEEDFYAAVAGMRDERIWCRISDEKWFTKDSIINHREDVGVKEAALRQNSERTILALEIRNEDKLVLM